MYEYTIDTAASARLALSHKQRVSAAGDGSYLEARVRWIQCEVICGVELREARVGQVHLVAVSKPCRHYHHHHDSVQESISRPISWACRKVIGSRPTETLQLQVYRMLLGI